MRWARRHAPLVVLLVLSAICTAIAGITGNALMVSLAGNLWGLVVLLVVFDMTPRNAQEKQEKA